MGASDSAAASSADPASPREHELPSGIGTILEGDWRGPKDEIYSIRPKDGQLWDCFRKDAYATKRFTIKHGEDGLLWWGVDQKFFLDPTDLAHSGQARWFGASDFATRRPRFVWQWLSEEG